MFKSIVPIVEKNHRNLKVKKIDNFDFCKDLHLSSVMVHEFSRVSSIYPIIFLEDKDKDEFTPVVMLGLETGENLFIKDGVWNASYIPAIIRKYPFILANSGKDETYTICIDEESEFLNEEEGEELFDKKGKSSKTMENIKQFLTELQQMDNFSSVFCKYFQEKNMFTPLNMKVKIKNELKNVSGAYILNEDRLNNLSNESFLDMREKQYLPAVYAHLNSLAQIERLVNFKDKNSFKTKTLDNTKV